MPSGWNSWSNAIASYMIRRIMTLLLCEQLQNNILTTSHGGIRMNPQNIKSSGDQCWEKTFFFFLIIFFLTRFSLICIHLSILKVSPVKPAARSGNKAILTCYTERGAILLYSSVDKLMVTRNTTALLLLVYLHCDSAYGRGNHSTLL